jgi:HEAT repeat protein
LTHKENPLNDSALKLNDEQMRQFICDGVLIIDSGMDDSLHETIRVKGEAINRRLSEIGANILPAVSELQRVFDAAPIKGALQSILGEDYMLHPQRLLVPSEPLEPKDRNIELRGDEEGMPQGENSRSYTYWHKDTSGPRGRARYHVPRYLYLFYFPQDTPVKMGPTRVIPGSHYQDHLSKEDHSFAYVPDQIHAGTCILASIDIEHAGMSNLTDQTRYMYKFTFTRTSNPMAPSWDGGNGDWRPPESILGRYEHPETWSYMWNWLRGNRSGGTEPACNIAEHIGNLNSFDQQKRLAAIYSLGAMGEPALQPLLNSLLSLVGQNRIEPPYVQQADGKFVTKGDPRERRWTEGGYIFQDEAYALGCLGEIAVDPLNNLLDHPDPWIRINAAFALGEIGSAAGRAIPTLSAMLDDPDHRVVRAVLEAIACIGMNTKSALAAIERLLDRDRASWDDDMELASLPGDQIHINAAYALLLSDIDPAEIEDLMIELLERPAANVTVPAVALEFLIRHGGDKSFRHAISYLQAHRWYDRALAL